MNDRRLARLKRLAVGAALVGATVSIAEDAKQPVRTNSPPSQKPEVKYVNSPPNDGPEPIDAGVAVEPAPQKPEPRYINSPKPPSKLKK